MSGLGMSGSLATPPSSLVFAMTSPSTAHFGPRLATLTLTRADISNHKQAIDIATPGLTTATVRGVVPHLHRDHLRRTDAIRWVDVPFETFLEHTPPVPTLQPGPRPLHEFLGLDPTRHLLCMLARDPADPRELPANGKDHLSTYCIRGVRKLTPAAWRALAQACNPDVVLALADTPYTAPPHSQKRLAKSVERSAAWLADLLAAAPPVAAHTGPAAQPIADADSKSRLPGGRARGVGSSVFVQMAGGTEPQARRAFADALVEPLEAREAARLHPLSRLDDGVAGYVLDLRPLRAAGAGSHISDKSDKPDVDVPALLRASLGAVPREKPRAVHGARTPHEVLRLVRDVGVDLFDAHWAQRAADVGVALDFRFPVPDEVGRVEGGKRGLGHNLYSPGYANDHKGFAESLRGAASVPSGSDPSGVCPCIACSPRRPTAVMRHSAADVEREGGGEGEGGTHEPPYTRAYVHHLLHTHEMSAHALLAAHNLAVLDAFFAGVRAVLARAPPDAEGDFAEFAREVERFAGRYEEGRALVEEAERDWREVDLKRGKGRLAREKAKLEQGTLGGADEL